MSTNNSNRINVPEARQAMENMKQEVANELGITLNKGYNGNLASKDAGHIGGNMVKNVLPMRSVEYRHQNRIIGARKIEAVYKARLIL